MHDSKPGLCKNITTWIIVWVLEIHNDYVVVKWQIFTFLRFAHRFLLCAIREKLFEKEREREIERERRRESERKRERELDKKIIS